jgi:phosphoribosylglycinamide formyltransferase-1
MIRLAIFASGEGTNAQRFIDYFGTEAKIGQQSAEGGKERIVVSLIVSDNPAAKVLERAKKAGVPHMIIDWRNNIPDNKIEASRHVAPMIGSEEFAKALAAKADFIVLAGFLRLVPDTVIRLFPGKIVNIHPALLPKYGGRGMYGNRVHEAVIANKEKKSGITIHLVNERYDEGAIIFQKECEVKEQDTPLTLAVRIHQLEHGYYPEVVEKFIRSLPS